MEQETWEVLVVLAMLVALTVIGALQWVRHRALSWGAFGVCLMVPEAVSRQPDEALLYGLMGATLALMLAQWGWDWYAARRARADERAQQPSTPAAGVEVGAIPSALVSRWTRWWPAGLFHTPWRRG